MFGHKQQQTRLTVVEQLAEEFKQQLLDAGYPEWQVVELLEQQGALWGNELPGACKAYFAAAERLENAIREGK